MIFNRTKKKIEDLFDAATNAVGMCVTPGIRVISTQFSNSPLKLTLKLQTLITVPITKEQVYPVLDQLINSRIKGLTVFVYLDDELLLTAKD